jgi:hypothetical protein
MSWVVLSKAFTSNFQATYSHRGNAFILGRVTMKSNERLRNYTNRFFENRNTCVGIRDDQVVECYKKGIRDHKILDKIHESRATIVAALMDIVNKLIDTNKALVNQFDFFAQRDAGTSSTAADSSSKLRKQQSEVFVVERHRPSMFNIDEYNVALDSACNVQRGGHPHCS